jgi:maleylacetate reductase
MEVASPVAFVHESAAQRVVFGWGAATALDEEVGRLGASRVLVVATEGEWARAGRACAGLPTVGVFTDVRPHVPVEAAEKARAAATEADADLVLSIGGGSTTGMAKAVALTSGLPVLAVPTTYAGSEVTPVWGLTQQRRKTTGTDPRVQPRTVVYDPHLTLGLPVDLSVVSGLNALAHGVDALWAPRANPVSSALATEGTRMLARGLPGVRRDGDDRDARSRCLVGAYLCALAFAAAGSGLHHKICHVLGGAYDLPHAATHAVVLPHVLGFNAPAVPEAAARVADVLGSDDPVAGLHALVTGLRAPRTLRELGMGEDHLDEAAVLVVEAAPADNPRAVTVEQARALLGAAWAGETPTRLETT